MTQPMRLLMVGTSYRAAYIRSYIRKPGARAQHTEWTSRDAFKAGAALSGNFIAHRRVIARVGPTTQCQSSVLSALYQCKPWNFCLLEKHRYDKVLSSQ
jgi:hypothetical protein